MHTRWVALTYGVTALAAIAIVISVGCGGGGGGQPLHSSPSTAFAALLPAAQKNAGYVGEPTCAKCHSTEATQCTQTVHAQNKVTCESCHGPGSVHSAAPSTTNILTYPNISDAAVCAQCHAAQATDWAGSPHGSLVADVVSTVQSNNVEAETCFRCHSSAFRDANIDHPISVGETSAQVNTNIGNLTSAQLAEFANTPQSTASCVTCHDPHQNTPNLPAYGSLAGAQLGLRRATASQDTTDIGPGASIATYSTYGQICGSCHNSRGANPALTALPSESSRPPFHEGPEMNMLLGITGVVSPSSAPSQGSHYLASDQCVHCHMPNGSHTFTVNLDVSCVPCHSTTDAANQMQAVQTTVLNDLVGLQGRLQAWSQNTYGANNPDSWDYTANIPTGETVPTQSTVPLAVQIARYNYYYVVLDRSNGVHNAPYAEYLLAYADSQLSSIGAPAAVKHVALSIPQMKSVVQPYLQRAEASEMTGGRS